MFVRLGSSLKQNVLYRSSIFSSGFAGSFYGNPLPRSLGYRLNRRARSLVFFWEITMDMTETKIMMIKNGKLVDVEIQ